MSKPKYSFEIKVDAVKRYLAGESAMMLAHEYGMPKKGCNLIRRWSAKYQEHGDRAFEHSRHNRRYTKEFKQKVVDEYLSGNYSQDYLTAKYNITSHTVVENWIRRYNEGIENKDYCPNNEVYAMKSRKTTIEERLEIVNYVLNNNNDYKGAAKKYFVPYANVYQWVLKYNKFGKEGLSDRRGRKASNVERHVLTELEKKDVEIERLQKKLDNANMVIEVLKKKKEKEEQFLKDSRSFAKAFCTKQSKNSK